MTYHGAKQENKDSKIHLKAKSRYKTLIDDSLLLPADIDVPVPLFALETGYANHKKTGSNVSKSGHKISTEHPGFVRVDFYLASLRMDANSFVNSMYFFNLFWTQDYLAAAKNNVLNGGLIIAPILFVPMGEYMLVVRRSLHHIVVGLSLTSTVIKISIPS